MVLRRENGEENAVPFGKGICYTNTNIKDIIDIHNAVKQLKEEGNTEFTFKYVQSCKYWYRILINYVTMLLLSRL